MATLEYFLPFSEISLGRGATRITENSSTRLEVSTNNSRSAFIGHGLDASRISLPGTITGFEHFSDSQLAFRIDGFSVSFLSAATSSNPVSLFLADDDIVYGSSGADRIDETYGGSDRIWARDGDDLIIDQSGSDYVHGGNGLDTLRMSSHHTSYNVNPAQDGTIRIAYRFSSDVETIESVERVEFRNGTLAFDVNEKAGQAYRLYQAAFDRTPDAEGLGFWIDHYDAGNVDLVEMAGWFMQSEEFATKYGAPETVSDEAFLTLLYNNVLDRDPDQEGFDFWRGHQDNGLTRAEMIQYFSESEENYANVASSIEDGIWFV